MSCTLYRFYDERDRLLYIGITTSAATRLVQHSSKEWFPKVTRASFEHYRTRAEARAAEVEAIKGEAPLYNIAHVDGPGEMDSTDAAEYLRVDVDTVERWAKAGTLPSKQRSDGSYRFQKAKLSDWLRGLRAEDVA